MDTAQKGEGKSERPPALREVLIRVSVENYELLERFKAKGISYSGTVRFGLDLLAEKPIEKAVRELAERARKAIPRKVERK